LWLFKGRRYPIKKDASGLSGRKRAFALFSKGKRPSQITKEIPISFRTACRYHADYRKLHHTVPYSTIRRWLRESPEFSEQVIDLLAASLDMSRNEVISRMQKPWGLMQAMKGRWPNYKIERERTEIEDRLLAALEVVKFAELFGQKDPKFVQETLHNIYIERGGH